MQCSKRAVCFCLIENVTVHAYVYSNGTLPVVFAPIIFAENMVKCTEITTGEDLGVTGFWFWKTSEEDAKTKTSERSESNLIKRRSMYE